MKQAASTIIFAAVLLAHGASARNFQPPVVWSAGGGEVVEVEAFTQSDRLVQAGDAAGLWVSSTSPLSGLVLNAVLRPGQPPAYGQIGDTAAFLAINVVGILAANDELALLRLREGSEFETYRRDSVAAIDLGSGGIRWAAPLAASRAAILPGGDVLLQTPWHLLRLDAAGRPRWVQTYADLIGPHEELWPRALHASGEHAIVEFERQATFNLQPSRLQAFSLADGASAWRVDGRSIEARACGIGTVAGAVVVAERAEFDSQGLTTLTLDRRSSQDGTLLARTVLPQVPGDDTVCRVLDIDGAALLMTEDDRGDGVLASAAVDGNLRWRLALPRGFSRAIARIPGTSDVVHAAAVPDDESERIERLHAGDGTRVWEVVQARRFGSSSRTLVATPSGIQLAVRADSRVVVFDIAPADGGIIGTRQLANTRRSALPYDADFVDGVPFDAAIGADGRIIVRRRSPSAGSAVIWSRSEPGAAAPTVVPAGVVVLAAGPGRLLAIANYRVPDVIDRRRSSVLLMFDRDTGAMLWRRELAGLADAGAFVLDAGSGGVIVGFSACTASGNCTAGPYTVQRRSALDGSVIWENAAPIGRAALAGADLVSFQGGAARGWRLSAAVDGSTVWSQPVASTITASDLALLPGAFLAIMTPFSASSPFVDVERRSLATGSLVSTFRAGLLDDRVSAPLISRAVNGAPLLTARLLGPEAGQENRSRALVQLLDSDGTSSQLMARPPLSGADRWWTLRAVGSSTGSITRQPLRSLRYLESLDAPYNSRVALSHLDLGSGELGGEHLIERRFDDPLRGETQLDLVQVLSGGEILAGEQRLFADGLRRRTLIRLAAPADAGGDLRLRLLDAGVEATGFGPSRRIQVEVDNVGGAVAEDASFGIAARRDRDFPYAVFAACSVVSGSGTCPVDASVPRISLSPGATVRLEWEVYDPAYRPAPPSGVGPLAGARIFIDSPWGYADIEPGNNVVEVALRLGAFGDGFE